MILESKRKQALKAIHDLIIEGRVVVLEAKTRNEVMNFLDALEYLPALLLEDEDKTQLFEEYLEEICITNNCIGIFNKYMKK